MSSRLRGLVACLVILSICTIFGPRILFAEDSVYAGRNINMVSGLQISGGDGQPLIIGGDPYLQRQNEPSIAVSTRNPMHLLAGANDYRTVDIPFPDPDPDMVGDAWLGLFKSFDGGKTWQSTLLPDYPQSQGAANGDGCPKNDNGTDKDSILGCQAAADPTVRAGTNGMIYYSGIAFDRNKKHLSRLFVSRFIDLNNREGAFFDVSANKDPIKYIDTHVVNIGTPGQFTDKPWLAVDIPRDGATSITLEIDDDDNPETKPILQQFKCGNMYLAYAVFLGNAAENPHTKVEVRRSIDCGKSWEKPIKVSEGYHVNQGATLAIDPQTGHVYVAWHVFRFDGDDPEEHQEPQIVIAKSIDQGLSFSKADRVAFTNPFNQPTLPETPGVPGQTDPFRLFRTNAYPTLAVDDHGTGSGRLYIAWSERDQWGGDNLQNNITPNDGVFDGSRIMFSYSKDQGASWVDPYPVDVSDLTDGCYSTSTDECHAGHQIMPSLSYGGGKLSLLFYDFKDDYYIDLYNSIVTATGCNPPDDPDCQEVKETVPLDPSLPPADAVAFEPYPVRHTINTRLAMADATQDYDLNNPDTWPFHVKRLLPVSQYPSAIIPDSSGSPILVPLQSNQVNLPLFSEGKSPFIGDYIDLSASSRFVPDEDNPVEWKYNSNTEDASIFHAVWTDNRDVIPPPVTNQNGELERPDWTKYTTPPTSPGQECPADSWPGMRNQNIYTSRITEGLVLGSLGNSKPININRAFSVFLENTIQEFDSSYFPLTRSFRLMVDAPDSVEACFDPFPEGGTCPNPVEEESGNAYKLVNMYGLSRIALTIFAKPVSPQDPNYDPMVPIKVTAEETEWNNEEMKYTPKSDGLRSSLTLNADPTNPVPLNEDEAGNNLSVSETHDPEFVPFSCSDFEGLPDEVLTNCGGATESISSLLVQWPSLIDPENPALLNPALLNTTLNPALLNPALLNPALLNPALLNPALLNPALLNPALMNPALLNPTETPAPLTPALLNPAPAGPSNLGIITQGTLLTQNTVLDPEDPDLKPATLTDLTWRVKNIGNNGSSYLFSWYSNLDLQQKPSQILVYRTYRTPSMNNDCFLNEAYLHHEFLVNILDDSLLTPALLNTAMSFGMAPTNLPGEEEEDYIYITLRFLDGDGQDGDLAVNPDDVAVAAEAEAPPVSSAIPEDPPTSVALFTSDNIVESGQTVTFTVSVNSAAGNPTFGQVTLMDGSTELESKNLSVSNTVDFARSDLSTGIHIIKARYNGVPELFGASSSGPVIQHVKLGQSISFDPLNDISTQGANIQFTLNATASSGLVVSFSANLSGTCSVNGTILTINGFGKCTVTATQAGDETYLPANDVVRSFIVTP